MGRTLEEFIASLPEDEQRAIDEKTAALMAEIEGLQALRELVACSQRDIAERLHITQPAVHKMEKQTDLYLSTLRRYVEAAGGTLELQVNLPGKGTLKLMGVGEIG